MKYRIFLFLFFAFSLTQKVLSQTPNTPCDSILKIGLKYYQQQNFKEAIPAFETSLRLCSKDTGLSDLDYYVLLSYLSSMYYEVNMEDSALVTGESARKYFQKVKYINNAVYAGLTGRLGLCYSHRGQYAEAINCMEEVVPFYEKTKGTTSEQYIAYSMQLATYYSALSQFGKSLAVNRRLKEIVAANFGKEDNYYIGFITNMGNDFVYLSQYDSALIYHSESLQLREKKFGKNHIEYGKGLSNLGGVYNNMSRYSDALVLYEQARFIYANAKQEKHPDYAGVLSQLGLIYTELGDHLKANKYLQDALDIKLAVYGYYHPAVASIYNNLASLYSSMSDYNAAIKMYHSVKIILEQTTGMETHEYANAIGNLGNAYASVNKYDSALYFLGKSLVYKEKIFGKDNYALGSVLNNLASVYSDLKNYDKAIEYFNKSIAIVEKAFGQNAQQLSSINGNLALVYKAKGDVKTADALLKKTYEIDKNTVLQNTEALSETEKETFSNSIKFVNYIGYSLRKATTLPNEWLYNSTLFYKGLLLEGSRGLTSAFGQFTDPTLKTKAKEYLELKEYVGKQLLLPASNRDTELQKKFGRAEELERELLQASAGFRLWKEQFNIEWRQLQTKLKEGEAVIEFVSYYPFDRKDSNTYYAALIIKQNSTEPQLLQLFKEADFNKLLTQAGAEAAVKKLYRSTIKSSTAQVQPSDSLYNIIWKPLVPAVENIKTIYFAADGVLSNLNLAAIITPQGKRLVEDYQFVQLTSTRNLLKPSTTPSFKELQLWGGVQYNESATTASGRSMPFNYLPGTLTEITEITNTVNNAGKKVKSFVAMEANETAFKNLSGHSPEVIHIATHGFFFPEPSKTKTIEDNRFAQSKVSLLRSGLALANANANWKEFNQTGEDGILTAYEIADMDLSKTKLVVLSACETGLGDIKSGEGVYGLQRAFKLAGVDYLIMSLWQVPDMETKEFMQIFYTHCMSGLSIRRAFRETQLAMNKKYQPYQWAAFVLVE